MKSSESKTIDISSKASFNIGIILQCTNKLSGCNSPEELIRIYQYLYDQISIPCYIRIDTEHIKINTRIGGFTLTKDLFYFLDNTNFINLNVANNNKYLACEYTQCLSIFDINCNALVDELQDILAIWCESVCKWIIRYNENSEANSILKSKIGSVQNKISSVTQNISRKQIEIPNSLISTIALSLGKLGMDTDHEEYVLDLIDNAIRSYNKCFNLQLESNIEVSTLLETIFQNLNQTDTGSHENMLEDNIVLF